MSRHQRTYRSSTAENHPPIPTDHHPHTLNGPEPPFFNTLLEEGDLAAMDRTNRDTRL